MNFIKEEKKGKAQVDEKYTRATKQIKTNITRI